MGNINELKVLNQDINLTPTPTQTIDSADGDTVKLSNCKREVEDRAGVKIICNSTRVINKPDISEGMDTGTTDQF